MNTTDKTSKITLTVPGMGSDHCAGIVRESLNRLDGIDNIKTNISNHQVTVECNVDAPAVEDLKTTVEKAGYEVASVRTDQEPESDDSYDDELYLSKAWRRFGIAAVPTALIMILMMVHMFFIAG